MRPRLGLRLLVLLGCASSVLAAEPSATERGGRLFNGELPLTGGLTGHTAPLPPQAVRCVNCHAAGSAGPTTAPAASTRSFGPVITSALLTQPLARRGGPPSRYDESTFCRLLATGVDSAHVIIPRSMPRYELSAADCHALWTYLTLPGR